MQDNDTGEPRPLSTASAASSASSSSSTTSSVDTISQARWVGIDVTLNTFSAGVSSAIWQFSYHFMYQHFQEAYYKDRPPINDPAKYFGHGYFWATNLVLGISGAVGTVLPYKIFGWQKNLDYETLYNFFVSFIPEFLFCTIYDAAWQATTDWLDNDDADYPTDGTQLAIVNSLIFLAIATTVHYLGNKGINWFFQKDNEEYENLSMPKSLSYGLGLMGFMLATKKLDKAANLLDVPIAFFSSATPRCIYELNYFRKRIFHCNSSSNTGYEEIPNSDGNRSTSCVSSCMEYVWSWCGGKPTRTNVSTADEAEAGLMNNMQHNKKSCNLCPDIL